MDSQNGKSDLNQGLDLKSIWSNVEIIDVRHMKRPGPLRAVMKVRVPAIGIEIKDVKVIHTEKYGEFVAPPDRKFKKRDGTTASEDIIAWTDGMARKAFKEACMAGFKRQRPPETEDYDQPGF